jgi:CheY-like chemotaxis protein
MNHDYKILVVDDDPEDHFIMQEYFTEAGLGDAVVFRENGEEALTYLATLPANGLPALIVLDLNMPVLNGLQTLTMLKGLSDLRHIHVVIYSTSNNDHERQQCLEQGARDYFVKPFTLQDGTLMVERFRQMLQDELHQSS